MLTKMLLLDASMLPAANDNARDATAFARAVAAAMTDREMPAFSDDWAEEEPTRHDSLAALGVTEFGKAVL